jgi:hypothetical protein
MPTVTLFKFLQIHNIWHRNLLVDITTDVNSIMKVKEYRFHMPIIIFSGNYSARSSQNTLQRVNCRDDPVSGSAMAAPFIRSSR